VFGYCRVSSADQNEARQIKALLDAGVARQDIFLDKQSGKDFNRDSYKELINTMQEGDTLVVKSIDRLGQNYTELIDQWKRITKAIKANINVLDMPVLNTSAMSKDLTATFISDLVLQILSYVAENERENIRRRQAEGIAAAKARGVQFGRPGVKAPKNFGRIVKQWELKEIKFAKVLELTGLKRTTFYAKLKEYRAQWEQRTQRGGAVLRDEGLQNEREMSEPR